MSIATISILAGAQAVFSFSMLQAVCRRAQHSFEAFFRRVSAGQDPGYPRFKGRSRLGLKTGDKIAFTVEDNEVRLRRTGSVVVATAGIMKSHKRPLTAEELRAAAEKAMAKEARERSR